MKSMFIIVVYCLGVLGAQTQPRQCLLLTAASSTDGDRAVSNHLVCLGFVVTKVTDTASASSDANGKDLIVVSSSVGSGNIGTKFTASPVPLINGEQAIYDELGIDANNVGGATLPGQTQINIVDSAHPLAAGLPSGLLTVLTAPGPIVELGGAGMPVASAQIVALATDGRPAILGIEAGASLNPARIATAPARRVGMFWEATTFMTEDGLKLFDAAVGWATGVDASAPIGITLQPTNTTVNELMAATFTVGFTGASPYLVQWQRSDGAGGFTNIPGANCTTYIHEAPRPADSGAMFTAVVSNNFSGAASAQATLTVLADTNPPAMVSAFGAGLPPTDFVFDLVYSEPVEPVAAQDPFSYSLGNGAGVLSITLDADGKTLHFTCQPITNGTVLSLASPIPDRASTPNVLYPGEPGSSIAIIISDGSIRRHQFNGIGGVLISDLTNNARFPNAPDLIDFPEFFETPVNANENYGVHFLGYLTAPISGDYHFYMSSDDAGVLFLSTDTNPANKRMIAFELQWANSREWTGNAGNPAGRNAAAPQNQSRTLFPAGIPLVKGQRYYVEAMMKEGTGGDNLAVAWQRPGDPIPANSSAPIPGLYLSRYDQPVTIPPSQPADQVLLEARQAMFSVTATGSPLLSYQWYENEVAIPGATGPAYTTALLTTNDSGKSYYVTVSNPFSAATSRVALLTVNLDTNGPTLLSASSVHSMDVGLCFDEALDPVSAANPANYTINGGAISVSSATLRYDGRTVQLALGGPLSGGFTVQANNLLDLTGRNTIAPASGAAGSEGVLTPIDLGTAGDPAVPGSTFSCRDGEFELIAGGSDIWGNADHGQLAYETLAGNFDKRVLVARLDNTDVSAKGGLMVRESTNSDSRNLHAIVMPAPPARNIYETGTRSVTAGATAGWGVLGGANGNVPANHPNSWVRMRRVGNTFSAYASSNGMDWVKHGESIQSYPESVVFGLAATAHNNNGPTNRVLFQNFSDTAYPGSVVTITHNPVNVTGEANHFITFSAGASVSGAPASELAYQWQREDGAGGYTNIISANNSNHTFVVLLSDNNAQFRVVAFVPGASATSSVAMLTVTNDIAPPRIISASRGLSPTNVTVVFDEFLEMISAQDSFNYSVDGPGTPVSVAAPVLGSDGRTVRFTTTAPLADNGFYVLTVNAVGDLAGNATANAQAQIRLLTGPFQAVGGQVVIETENFDTNTPANDGKMWQLLMTPGGNGIFSGAGYMQALPESGIAVDNPTAFLAPGASPRLDYRVNLPVAGTWRVWLRGVDFIGGANSCHVGVDGTAPNPNNFRIGNTGNATGWGDGAWKWTRDANDSTSTFADIRITTPGLHTFNLWMREDSVIVDKILLTTDTANIFPVNTVLGPEETSRGDQAPVRVNITFASGNVTLSWNLPAAIGRLQQADQVTGLWSDVDGADPNGTVLPANAMQKFYRVAIP